eukprot:5477404-Pyramimonas_sp.AAC.1
MFSMLATATKTVERPYRPVGGPKKSVGPSKKPLGRPEKKAQEDKREALNACSEARETSLRSPRSLVWRPTKRFRKKT